MFANGDKLVTTKKIAGFLNEGDIIEVVSANDSGIVFTFGEGGTGKGVMSLSECEKYFEKIVEKEAPSVTSGNIDEIIANSEFIVNTVFDKCAIVACRLPNGFVIVESSACVSPENFDEKMAVNICMDKIVDKIWELEGYRLQEDLYVEDIDDSDYPYGCTDCDECPCDTCCEACMDEEVDKCLDTDLDCDDCMDFDCPHNNNR